MSEIKKKWQWKGIEIIDYLFPDNQYYKTETKKIGVIGHHTASGEDVEKGEDLIGDVNWWKQTKERVGTCVGIVRNGGIGTLFDSKFWAHALGIKIAVFDKFGIKRIYRIKSNGKRYVANNQILNENFIQYEIDSWGRLTKKNGKYYTWTGKEIDKSRVQYYPNKFRGSHYFEKYTSEQIESLRLLLLHWQKEYNLDLSYKGDIMWQVNKRALSGESGHWAHCSFREDKDDLHPQEDLIEMFKSI